MKKTFFWLIILLFSALVSAQFTPDRIITQAELDQINPQTINLREKMDSNLVINEDTWDLIGFHSYLDIKRIRRERYEIQFKTSVIRVNLYDIITCWRNNQTTFPTSCVGQVANAISEWNNQKLNNIFLERRKIAQYQTGGQRILPSSFRNLFT